MNWRVPLLIGLVFVAGVWMGREVVRAVRPAPGPPTLRVGDVADGDDADNAGLPLPDGLSDEELRDIDIFRAASRSVVNVSGVELRRSFRLDLFEIPRESGTGFYWDDRGHIVTNYHVIDGSNRLWVTLPDRTRWPAAVVGAAPEKDIAVLKLEAGAPHQPGIERGDSGVLRVGRKVLALGNPFGLDQTLTMGVVSALDREIDSPTGRKIRGVIQTDAAINPGNSGGPLLDSDGRLIGVNTTIVSPSGGSSGIGFAIPIDAIERLVPQLILHGRLVEPGIEGVEWLSSRRSGRLGVEGVVVYAVEPGSGASRLGIVGLQLDERRRLRLGDVVVAVDGESTPDLDALRDRFDLVGVDGNVELTVQRAGNRRSVTVRLSPVG
ncbi:MAG: trypsin-like peptidase domain-containing protein [Acidobacteriota bacterium]|nr:trypsin-like peptidase domain-containing protein [Acidobacteriota bacterium]MDH3784117.1 trypsin-like peptidase domain-containing protein [Acidobacteriota bacterium]